MLYDQAANRWFLSEFADGGNHLCVYVSKTADPTGQYWAYDFTTPNFPDYPKYGVWPDAYYVTTNEDSGPAVYALERSDMLNGVSASMQRFTASPACPVLAGPSPPPIWMAPRRPPPVPPTMSCATGIPKRIGRAACPLRISPRNLAARHRLGDTG